MSISAVLLAGLLLSTAAFGQGSGRAVMRVSVKIVQWPSVASSSPATVGPVPGRGSRLGSLTLERVESNRVLIHISQAITLRSSDGEDVTMDVRSKWKRLNSQAVRIFLQGYWGNQLSSGSYSGELETTLEYF